MNREYEINFLTQDRILQFCYRGLENKRLKLVGTLTETQVLRVKIQVVTYIVKLLWTIPNTKSALKF